jgi:two-component system sensor histidine kinase KdpD
VGRQVGWEKRLIRSLAAAAAIAGLTFGFSRIISVNSTTVSLSFLLVVLAIATGWGLYEAIVASIAGVLCFNFFFLPPIGHFTIADPQNWVALLAFLVTSIVASQLSARAKNRAMEATRRQHEMERLYELSRSLLLLDSKALTAGQLPFQIARVFGFPAVAVFDRASGETHRAGPSEISVSDARMRDAAAQGTASAPA